MQDNAAHVSKYGVMVAGHSHGSKQNFTKMIDTYPRSLKCPAASCGSSGASKPELYATHSLAVSG